MDHSNRERTQRLTRTDTGPGNGSARAFVESRLSSVDFPLPEGPSSATRSPRRIENDAGSSPTTLLSPVPNWRARPSALTIGSIIDDPPILEPNDARGGSG